MEGLRHALDSLVEKSSTNQLIIKPADKGDIIVVMSAAFYHEMCMNELSKPNFYQIVGDTDPSDLVLNAVMDFCGKYESLLTNNEIKFLTERKYKMAYFYMLPKLHKSEFINNNIGHSEYVKLTNFDQPIEGRPIVGGPCFYTSGLSEMVSIILKPIVDMLPQVLQDSFDLIERTETTVAENVLLGSCDIKSLYTNISADLAFRAIDFWISKYGDSVPTFQRFNKNFVLGALQIVLDCNYFLFNDYYVKQIKGFAMGTKAAVVCANLIVGFLELRMFDLLPTIYPQDVVDFIIRNYFRFLDDIFYKWLEEFDVSYFYQIFDELDEDLKFIFSQLSRKSNFLDIHFKIIGNEMILNLYYKPTDSHNYLNYTSAHPLHTRNNIALSLAKRIVKIVSDNRDEALDALKNYLIARDHPEHSINDAFSRVFQPRRHAPDGEILVFISTYNQKHRFHTKVIKDIVTELPSQKMRKIFGGTKVVMGTRQPSSLRKMLTKSNFSLNPVKKSPRVVGLFGCPGSCKYERKGYLRPCTSFNFGRNGEFHWEFNRFFNCDSRNVIYLLQCNWCWKFYIGETGDFKQRTSLHKSNAKLPENSNCKTLSWHLNRCSRLREPYFHIYPFYFVNEMHHRRFIEKRFIHLYKPPLNDDK